MSDKVHPRFPHKDRINFFECCICGRLHTFPYIIPFGLDNNNEIMCEGCQEWAYQSATLLSLFGYSYPGLLPY